MDIRKLNDEFSVGKQISTQETRQLAELGYKTIICNRPDAEDDNQPSFASINEAAKVDGLNAHHLPVVPGGITEHDINAFALVLAEFPSPVFAYCRTGTRAAALWALTEAKLGVDVDLLLNNASQAGCDLSGMRALLEAKAKEAAPQ
jgi:sulfide:quinone oxidoreductase